MTRHDTLQAGGGEVHGELGGAAGVDHDGGQQDDDRRQLRRQSQRKTSLVGADTALQDGEHAEAVLVGGGDEKYQENTQ